MKKTLIFLFFGIFAYSQTIKHVILDTKPWGYYNSLEVMEGILSEYSDMLSIESGIKIEKSLAPYARIWRDLDRGKVDFTFLIKSKERKENVDYVRKFFTFHTIILTRKGVKLKDFKDIKSLRLGVLLGSKMNKAIDQDENIKKIYFRTYKIMLKMLKEERIDGVIGLEPSLYFLACDMGISDILGDRFVLENKAIWMHFSKKNGNEKLYKRIKKAMRSLEKKNVIEELLVKYLGYNWRRID